MASSKSVGSRSYAPFGTSAPRFGASVSHPNLDPSGLYIERPDACDPCLYHPRPKDQMCILNTKIKKDPWRYKVELEEWAENLGYRNQRVLEYRRYRRTLLGPAWHDVRSIPQYQPACKNVGFGRTPRSRPSKKSLPGPGTYYKNVPFKAPYGPHSTRPSFEREEPCRFKDTTPKWALAPNRYTIIDKDSLEQRSKRVVSLRGPYDLFTGKRDGSTIKNHFSTQPVAASSWPMALKGSLEKYKKTNFGKMNKTNRDIPYMGRIALVDLSMSKRKAEEPGPASYTVEQLPRVFEQNKRPFNSSYDKGPGYQRVVVWPGVGRYSPSDGRCGLPGRGHRHVFISKVGRTVGAILPQPMNSF